MINRWSPSFARTSPSRSFFPGRIPSSSVSVQRPGNLFSVTMPRLREGIGSWSRNPSRPWSRFTWSSCETRNSKFGRGRRVCWRGHQGQVLLRHLFQPAPLAIKNSPLAIELHLSSLSPPACKPRRRSVSGIARCWSTCSHPSGKPGMKRGGSDSLSIKKGHADTFCHSLHVTSCPMVSDFGVAKSPCLC